jgi:NAD(P)H-dependent FMN reductase
VNVKVKVIIGTTRQRRFGDKPAHWIYDEAMAQPDVEVELLDLRDYPLPFFDEPKSPLWLNGHTRTKPSSAGPIGLRTATRSSS